MAEKAPVKFNDRTVAIPVDGSSFEKNSKGEVIIPKEMQAAAYAYVNAHRAEIDKEWKAKGNTNNAPVVPMGLILRDGEYGNNIGFAVGHKLVGNGNPMSVTAIQYANDPKIGVVKEPLTVKFMTGYDGEGNTRNELSEADKPSFVVNLVKGEKSSRESFEALFNDGVKDGKVTLVPKESFSSPNMANAVTQASNPNHQPKAAGQTSGPAPTPAGKQSNIVTTR